MKAWMIPTLGAFLFWGIYSFIPKLVTAYINPRSATIYQTVGIVAVTVLLLVSVNFRPDVHARGITLSVITGVVGGLGAFCFLIAVSRGPVSLVSTVTALYPAIPILLAVAFLHEPVTLRQVLGMLLALVALVLIAF